jgi:predicted nucleotidyltransferase
MTPNELNLAALETVAAALGELRNELVLVGGCSVGLLISDEASPPVRETLDVDLVAEVATAGEYYRLCEKLTACGFQANHEQSHICRWVRGEIKLDVMPSSDKVLGHSTNRWYADAILTATKVRLASGLVVRVITAPLFLATKLEAFYDRGEGDYASSHDLEDIINVIDGRPELLDEVNAGLESVRNYLQEEFDELLADERFVDAIPMHVRGDAASQARVPLIAKRLRQLAGL